MPKDDERKNLLADKPPDRSPPTSERLGTAVAIHLEYGRWVQAHAVVDYARRLVEATKAGWKIPGGPQGPAASVLERPIAEMGLPLRTVNTLEGIGLFFIGDLLARSREDLIESTPNLGQRSIDQILNALERMGFQPEREQVPQCPERGRGLTEE